MRAARQQAILGLLEKHTIGTQEALHRALRKVGVEVDQSTLSRDLRELGVKKVDGRYVQPPPPADRAAASGLGGVVRTVTPCGPHLVVLKTVVGQAQPVALAIDARRDAAIVATLAGDDTVFIATRNRKAQAVALRRLHQWFGEHVENG
jgi:transcriptional regulator of arginine metabolism